MAGIKALVGLAFAGSIGLTFVVLGCALPGLNWWPLFVLFFYILAPIPMVIAKRYADEMAASSLLTEIALFITTGIVISAFALPIILARSPKDDTPVIHWKACAFVSAGNIVVFIAILVYFIIFNNDEIEYMW